MRADMRQSALVLTGQLRAALISKRVWMGYLIGVLAALKTAFLYVGYADGRPVQILEPWLMNFRTFGDVTIMLAGFILVIADAPFVDFRSVMTIYRTTRKNWFNGMCLYIIVQGIIYYLSSLAVSCLYTMRCGYIQDQWSRPMTNLIQFPSEAAITRWHLAPPEEELLNGWFPWQSSVHTFLLIFLYSLILGLLLYILNAGINRAVGTVAAAVVHVGGIMIMDNGFIGWMDRWSLMANCCFMWHFEYGIDFFFSYTLLLLCVCLLLLIGPAIIRNTDFRHSIGDGYE